MKRNRLTLPSGTRIGSALTLVYSKELTEQAGFEVNGLTFGTYHGFLLKITPHRLRILFIYSDSTLPELATINLMTGVDEEYEMVVSDIRPCPISTIEWAVRTARVNSADTKEEDESISDEEPSASVRACQGGLPGLGKRR